MDRGAPKRDLVNSMSPLENASGGIGSEVRVKDEGPVVLMHESGAAVTGLGQEITLKCADPSSAMATVRKAGDAIAFGAGSKGVHSMEGVAASNGERAAMMIARCWSARSGSGWPPLVAPNMHSFLVSWAVVPLVDSRAAWMWRIDVEDIASDVLIVEALLSSWKR